MKELMLSIVVITYNQEKYIAQTLDSILNQNHEFSYEIIVGNDCSSDNTALILKDYEEKYSPIIKVINNTVNKGVIKNYFDIINMCSGKYIMECAGDDYWLKDKVTPQIKFMESNPDIGMCYANAEIFSVSRNKKMNTIFGSSKTSFADLLIGNNIPAMSVCFRKYLIRKYVEEVDPVNKDWLMEDYPFWLWLSIFSKIAYMKNNINSVYRIFDDSISHSADINKSLRFVKSTYCIKKYFCDLTQTPIMEFDEHREIFKLLYGYLLSSYNKEIAVSLKNAYLEIQNPKRKEQLIYCCSRNKFFFNVYILLKRLISR